MPKRMDLTGQKFNRLTILEFADVKNGMSRWKCRCDCGKEVVVFGAYMKNNNTQSCDCLHKEECHTYGYKHGYSKERIYTVWASMKDRCSNNNSAGYQWYGGKGIKVCSEWLDFISFKNWAESNGYDDSLTIDRVDPDKDYCPENCQWIPFKENLYRMLDSKERKLKWAKDPEGKEYYEFLSATEFAKKHNLRRNSISEVLRGKIKTHKGWTFGYVEN